MAANMDNWGMAFFTTSTADLPTNTTLGTATRLVFTMPDPIPVPETTSRTFKSVILRVSFNDRFTVANEITAVRLGIQLGAAAFADTDVTFTQANSGDHLFDEWTLDCTAYFNTNFGAGASQTCTAALAVATTIASNVGGNVTAFLEYTYAYDDTVGTTRARTVMAMIGSQGQALSTVQQEIGLDGVAPPSTGQIPNLSTYIEEAGVTFTKHIAIIIECNNGSTSAVDGNPEIQIDATAVQLRGVVGQALTTWQVYRDVYNYDPTVYSTSTTHTFKMRDTTTTSRFYQAGGIMWITYTYNKSTSTRMMNLACVALEQSNDAIMTSAGGTTANVAADELVFFAKLDIQEPGTITIKQSGVQLRVENNAGGSNVFKLAAGTQADRTYTPLTQVHELVVHHRCESGWVLVRGSNRLQLKLYTTSRTGFVNFAGGMVWVCYSSDVPSGGTTVGNKPLSFFTCAYTSTLWSGFADIAASGAGQAAISFAAPYWKLSSFLLEGHMRILNGVPPQLLLKQLAGEYDGVGWVMSSSSKTAATELASQWIGFNFSPSMDAHSLTTGKLKPQGAHRLFLNGGNTFLLNLLTRITIHNITFTVAGTLKIDGENATNGKSVKVWAYDANNVAEYITTATVAGGAGAFTCQVPDDTRTYFCTHQNGSDFGASQATTPGGSFSIAVRASAIELTGQPAVQTTATTAAFTFTASGPVEYSLDGAGYITTTSPLNLVGLSAAVHTITFRVIADTTDKQVFTWTAGAAAGAADAVPPIVTTVSLPATSSDPVVIRAYDETALSVYQVTCKDRPEGNRLTCYNPKSPDLGFVHPFYGTVTGAGTSANPYIFTIYRRGRWPTGIPLDVRAQLVDFGGNEVEG